MNHHLTYTFTPSSLGLILIITSAEGVCAALLGDSEEALLDDAQQRFAGVTLVRDDRTLAPLAKQVRAYIDAPSVAQSAGDELKLDLHGTEFQQQVWRALQKLPAGDTITYGQLAAQLGRPTATRAVASACGANPVAVLVPCHRVVRSDGGLGGYRWGLERKRQLLANERRYSQPK